MCCETSNDRLIRSDLKEHLLGRLWKPRRHGHHVPELGARFEPVHLKVGSIRQLSALSRRRRWHEQCPSENSSKRDKDQFLAGPEVLGLVQVITQGPNWTKSPILL